MSTKQKLKNEWVLLLKEEKTLKDIKYIYEKWHNEALMAGIVLYRDKKEIGSPFYVVENYGLGSLNSKWKALCGNVIITRVEYKTETEARTTLEQMKKILTSFFK